MHLAEPCGPSRSLEGELRWLAAEGGLEVLLPGEGRLGVDLAGFAHVRSLGYAALTVPSGARAWLAAGPRFARETRTLRAAIRRAAPDLVIVTSALLPAALRAARAEGVPAILYAGEILDAPRVATRTRAFAGRAVLGYAARSARAVVACSDRVARQYSERGASAVTTIHPPIAPRYAKGDGDAFRRAHRLPDRARLIVAVGALSHGRGQDVLIRAVPKIRESHPKAHLAIVGDPHPREVDRAYARELLRLADQLAPGAVTFTGFSDRPEDAYAASTVVVNPTRYEAFGRVAFEALRAGRPVVSTAVGAIPDLLRDGEDSLLVPPESPASLAAAMVRVLGDPDLAARLVRIGSARVRSELDPAAALARFQAVVGHSPSR
jgi:glycosyltransferase involved in cell wall biosynthesis